LILVSYAHSVSDVSTRIELLQEHASEKLACRLSTITRWSK
jgi:hypothetical protein